VQRLRGALRLTHHCDQDFDMPGRGILGPFAFAIPIDFFLKLNQFKKGRSAGGWWRRSDETDEMICAAILCRPNTRGTDQKPRATQGMKGG
jgi:hypothetical protein